MMDIMVDMVKDIPFTIPEEVEMMARGLSALVLKEEELNTSAQVRFFWFVQTHNHYTD